MKSNVHLIVCVFTHVCVCVCTRVCVCAHTCVHMCACMCVCMCACFLCLYVCMCVHNSALNRSTACKTDLDVVRAMCDTEVDAALFPAVHAWLSLVTATQQQGTNR